MIGICFSWLSNCAQWLVDKVVSCARRDVDRIDFEHLSDARLRDLGFLDGREPRYGDDRF